MVYDGRLGMLLRDASPGLFGELVEPDDSLSAHSGRKVMWRCTQGHEWSAKVASRAAGSGCPYCSGRRRIVGVNDLGTTDPDLASELVDSESAKSLSRSSARKVWWRCKSGHEWLASPASRSQGNGCPVCSGHLVVAGVNDLFSTHPDIAAEAVSTDEARSVSHGSAKRLMWRCERGHEWRASVYSRTHMGNGCPVCSGVAARKRHDTLAQERPDLAAELVDRGLGESLSAGSSRYVNWRCANGHMWSATVANRVLNGQSCPVCSGRSVVSGYNDLATTHPDLAAQLVDRELAHEVGARSHVVARWRCEAGHEWDASVASRAQRGTGCPYCANRSVLAGFNDLATTDPDLGYELVCADEATRHVRGSHVKLKWRCGHGHEWDATIASRAILGAGCPYCSNRKASRDNSLASVRPDLAAQLVDASLAESLVVGSRKRVEWRCEHGHRWFARVVDRAGERSTGCPKCANKVSGPEAELADVVRALVGEDVEVRTSDRSLISPFELDVVVPSKKVAIEVNGVYWHSEDAGKGRNYHLDKRRACEAAGYRLVQVWEDDWRDCRDVVVRMLAAKLGCSDRLSEVGVDASHSRRLFARKLEPGEVSGHVARMFLSENHVQGAVSATRHFALLLGSEPVAVLSVRSPRNNARVHRGAGEWEVQRYATSCAVVGGFSRLLAHAERTLIAEGVELLRWVSFSSCDVSDGRMYAACGFSLDHELRPDYRYVGRLTGWRRAPKERYQRRRFRDDPDLVWDESWTEAQAARANGLHRCWDSGKSRWVRDVAR